MDKITLKSPAKLNLFLKVLGKRSDGYHDIETLFEKINLCDGITLKKRKAGIKIITNRADLPAGRANLAYKAAQLLFEEAGRLGNKRVPGGVEIEIDKKLPISAGLGGGSSNAAAVLTGLNTLYNMGFGLEKLSGLAMRIGADVAFFIYDYSFASGSQRGDMISPVRSSLKLWHVLVMPPFGVSTADIYRRGGFCGNNGKARLAAARKAVLNKDLTKLNNLLYNSLQGPVLARFPVLRGVMDKLIEFGAAASMISGSGPCVFGLTRTGKEAMGIERRLKGDALLGKKDWQVYTARTA